MSNYYAKSPNFRPGIGRKKGIKWPLIAILIVLLLIAGNGVYWYLNKNTGTKDSTPTNSNSAPSSSPTLTNEPDPNKEDTTTTSTDKQTETDKDKTNTTTDETDNTTNASKIVVNITKLTQDASTKKVTVGAIVLGLTDGKCELTMSGPNGEKVNKSASIINANTSYGCSNITLNSTEFASQGTWKATMQVTDTDGNKGETTKEIQITK